MSSINGISFALIVAKTKDELEQLYAFYKALGFRITKLFSKVLYGSGQIETVIDGTLLLTGISNDLVVEMWLELFPLQERDEKTGQIKPWQEMSVYDGDVLEPLCEATVIKLRLSASEMPPLPNSHGIYFFTTALDEVAKIVKQPKTDDYLVITEDPVGTQLIFSNIPSPVYDKLFSSPNDFLHHRKLEIMNRRVRRGLTVGLAPIRTEEQRKKPRKRIGVMTSGGDAPGMNPAVRAVVRLGIYYGCDVFAICEGYDGLVKGGKLIKQLTWLDVRGWLALGGTQIGTARCKEFREREGRLRGALNLVQHGIDALIVIGGDGLLTGADTLRKDWLSLIGELEAQKRISPEQAKQYGTFTIAGLVGLIDNDMAMTDATIGALLALARITEMVDLIDSTALSHSRAFVVEVMGRHCGWLGLMSGIACGADYIFIPERPPLAQSWRQELEEVCKRHREKGRRKTTVIVLEGAIDDELNPITLEMVLETLNGIGLDTRITKLGHVQRGGPADAHDRLIATLQGVEAVKAVLEATPDTPLPMISMSDGKIERKPLMEAVAKTQKVAECIANKDFDGAMKLRDLGFAQAWKAFKSTSCDDDGRKVVPVNKRLRIGLVHVGAALAGLDPATRAATLYCLSKGHKLFAIGGGFQGLVDEGNVSELSWIDVEDWHNKGGLEIGTNRTLPLYNIGMVAYYFQKYAFDGLVIVGGFEAFTSLHELYEHRDAYPIFNIPMVVVPATISNNVPGTEYSLGSNTCLDELIRYCDTVNLLALALRRRVFVVEVQGGHLGFVALCCGLATGAMAIYTPESKISLRTLEEDINLISALFADDRGEDNNGKLLIRNEQALTVYTTQLVADILMESSKGRFETRTAIPGHVQQGYVPLALDRIQAARFSVDAVQYIERHAKLNALDNLHKCRAVVIGISGGKMVMDGISTLYSEEADVKLRKGKTIHWLQINDVSDILSGRMLLRQKNDATRLEAVDQLLAVPVTVTVPVP